MVMMGMTGAKPVMSRMLMPDQLLFGWGCLGPATPTI
jgi:hypothetical protein